jgi:cytochrome c oxidase subunit IV
MSLQGSQSAAATKQDKAEPPVTPLSHFLWVLTGLLALLAISAGTALIKLGPWNTVINLGVAVIKALLVISVFMHETEARKLTRLTSALGFIGLAMLIGLTLFDFLTRPVVPSPWK